MREYGYLSLLSHQLQFSKTSFNTYRKALGQTIRKISCDYETLTLLFENGHGITITDSGQSCCEHRYMVCDDDTRSYVGATLLGMDLADVPEVLEEWPFSREVQFLRIHTSRGTIVVSNHNDGRYIGFCIEINAIATYFQPRIDPPISKTSKAPDPGGEGPALLN